MLYVFRQAQCSNPSHSSDARLVQKVIYIHAALLARCAAMPAGNADALYIMARQNQQRFEFIFTDLTNRQPGLAAALQALVAAYEASRPYRELRLRGARPYGLI
jgi:hypothetical protein